MKQVIIALLLVAATSSLAAAEGTINTAQRPIEWYLQQYPFIQYKGVIFSFENQFDWPSGFARVDSAKLTPYQFWISNLPLWFKDRPVGSLKHGTVQKADSISRVVHLPWRTIKFSDKIIPLHLTADYLFVKGQDDKLSAITLSGDTITFDRYLSGTVGYGPRQEIRWTPVKRRPPTEAEYDRCVGLIADNTTYRSLLHNCVSIAESDVLPGDFYITCDSTGERGRVAVALVTIENANGHRLYIFGTGCANECDFHIPLFNNRRDYPWTTTEEVVKRFGPAMAISGFYRIKLPELKR